MVVHSLTAQSVIGSLICLEETLGQLYGIYAERFPGLAEFWRHLALEKQLHAARMRTTATLVQDQNLDIGAERISRDMLRISRERIDSSRIVAGRETELLTASAALNSARELEEQTIGALPFEVFPDPRAPAEIRAVFRDLHKLQILHSASIAKKLEELHGSTCRKRLGRLLGRT